MQGDSSNGVQLLNTLLKGQEGQMWDELMAEYTVCGLSPLCSKTLLYDVIQPGSRYREFSPYANFNTANFFTAVFQNSYYNFANAILWAIYFVSAFIS